MHWVGLIESFEGIDNLQKKFVKHTPYQQIRTLFTIVDMLTRAVLLYPQIYDFVLALGTTLFIVYNVTIRWLNNSFFIFLFGWHHMYLDSHYIGSHSFYLKLKYPNVFVEFQLPFNKWATNLLIFIKMMLKF